MNPKEFFQLLGEISYNLTMSEFIGACIAENYKIVDSRFVFFGQQGFANKFLELDKSIENLNIQPEIIDQLRNWIADLLDLAKKRNAWIHSLVLAHSARDGEFQLSNIKSKAGKLIEHTITFQNENDLRELCEKAVKLVSEGFRLGGVGNM